jgi:hypothetical protein
MQPPFVGIRDSAVILKVVQGIRPNRPTVEECHGRSLPNYLWAVMESCWRPESHLRPPAYGIAYILDDSLRRDLLDIQMLLRSYLQLQMMNHTPSISLLSELLDFLVSNR